MRKALFVWFLILLAAFLAGAQCADVRDVKPQYIILICIDAARPDHLGCYGYSRNTSPRIDGLAARGILFEDAVSQAPWTLPSLATVLSSTFPCQHGASKGRGGQSPLDPGLKTFVEIISLDGYRTCAMSPTKIFSRKIGLRRVFEETYFIGEGRNVFEKTSAFQLTDTAVEWMREHLDEKFVLFLHHYDTHHPYKTDERCSAQFDPGYKGPHPTRFGDSTLTILKEARRGRLADAVSLSPDDVEHIKAIYDCEILNTDQAIGTLLDSLSAWGGLGKSLIIVFADHGEEFLEHGSIDHGQTVYEETIRVPLIIHAPLLVDEAVRVERQVGLIDLGPTILETLGLEIPAHFEGGSLLPLIFDRPEGSQRTARPSGLPASCIVSEGIAHRSEKKALRCPPWKLVFDPFLGICELYNIDDDPHEARNLVDERPGVVRELTTTLLTAMEPYYPGGWCVAWCGGDAGGTITGTIEVGEKLIEAIRHNPYPDVGPGDDKFSVGEELDEVLFSSAMGKDWEGIEVRMAADAEARFDIEVDGRNEIDVMIGTDTVQTTFPLTLSPSSARVDRKDLHRLLSSPAAGLAIYWIEPGSAPSARDQKEERLLKQLKSIGYIGN